jgi:hypothetical protein
VGPSERLGEWEIEDMNELYEQQSEAIVETALNEFPLAPLPPRFVAQVMARVAHLPQWRPEPFRLNWRDGIVPAITTVFSYLLLTLTLWLLGRDVAWLPDAPALFSSGLDSLTTVGWLCIAMMILVGEIGLLLWVGIGSWWDHPFLMSSDR